MTQLTGFAEACYDQNTEADLVAALAGQADETDCKTWGITAEQWRANIEAALAAKRADKAEAGMM